VIKNYNDYKVYIKNDMISLGVKKSYITNFFKNDIWRFQLSLRSLEYFTNCNKNSFIRLMIKLHYRALGRKLGFTIPINVFGMGLAIAHYGTIVINENSNIGKNCRIHVCVNIGSNLGSKKAPQLGDNCYIGPGVKLYGDIKVASNIKIGANSVVNKSFLEEGVTLVGVPAKIVTLSKI
jgi:serine O-acetyltransferase